MAGTRNHYYAGDHHITGTVKEKNLPEDRPVSRRVLLFDERTHSLGHGVRHDVVLLGWAPRGREAEDGLIPLRYQLTELADGGYRQRTRRNVQDSDGTLIANLGELEGGSLATQAFAQRLSKPHVVVPLDAGVTDDVVTGALTWLRENGIATLNVAGPRESKRPGIYDQTIRLLTAMDRAVRNVHG